MKTIACTAANAQRIADAALDAVPEDGEDIDELVAVEAARLARSRVKSAMRGALSVHEFAELNTMRGYHDLVQRLVGLVIGDPELLEDARRTVEREWQRAAEDRT